MSSRFFTDDEVRRCWIAARTGNVEELNVEELEFVAALRRNFADLEARGIAPNPTFD